MLRFWEQCVQDLRYALRMMAGHPLFTAMAALSLALGIGANTAIYSFMDSILLRALPVQNPQSLVVLNWHSKAHPPVARSFSGSTFTDARTGYTSGNFPYPVFDLFRDNNPVFSSIFAFNGAGRLNVQIHGQADLAVCQYVSGAFFSGLGIPPAAGRLIDADDDRAGGPAVAVTTLGYAQRRFGEAGKAVGQTILINDSPFTIVGVVGAPEFFGVNPDAAQDLYLPMHASVLLERIFVAEQRSKYLDGRFYWVQMMARLRPGVTMAQAQAALAPGFQRFVEGTATSPKERADLPALLLQEGAGGLDSLRRQYSKPLYVLMTMVGLILAIACANIANLLLARATARQREMAVRLSLGAGRWRVVRQLLTESILLASIGGVLGIAFAAWGIRALTLVMANGRDNFTLRANLNWHVLAVTVALSLVTGILFGLAPAMQSTRIDLASAIKQTRAGQDRVRLPWFRVSLSQMLVVSQIAISLLLLVAAGLFVRTLNNLNSIQLGFNRENLLLVSINARQAGYKDDALMRFYADLLARMSSLPGVRSATLSNYALVSNSRNSTDARVPGQPENKRGTSVLNIGPGFFTTMQIPILLGREINERDMRSPGRVAVVNELFARTYFANENPVGRHFLLGDGDRAKYTPDFEIIGVAKTARLNSLKQDIPEVAYVPYTQNPRQSLGQMIYELRAAGDPMVLAASARRAVGQADPRIPIANIMTQARQIDQTIGQERTFATLCTCFAVLAVLIACVGLYGTMAYSVARRTNEIGIRMALGAQRGRLIWMVLREVLVMSAVGFAIGLPVAFGTSHFLKSFLFQMKPNDPSALALAAAILLGAAVLAGYGPAWRASRIDPWTALRDE